MNKALTMTASDVFQPSMVHGQQELFTDIFDRYYQRIYNYLYYRAGNASDAEELASQVFEQVIGKIHSYSPERAPFEVWLFTMARNVFNDHYRRQKRRHTVSFDHAADLVSNQPSPEENAINMEIRSELIRAIQALPERERNIIAMKFAGGLKNQEIARLTGLSESNVGVIVYRSLHNLRDRLQVKE